jgi:hypothetical protein
VLALAADVKCASTMGQPSTPATERLTLAWLLNSVFLNVVLTTIIIATVWPARTVTAANPAERRVTSVIGTLAESAAGYTLVGLIFIGTIVARSRWQILLERAFGVTAVRLVHSPLKDWFLTTFSAVRELQHHHTPYCARYRVYSSPRDLRSFTVADTPDRLYDQRYGNESVMCILLSVLVYLQTRTLLLICCKEIRSPRHDCAPLPKTESGV